MSESTEAIRDHVANLRSELEAEYQEKLRLIEEFEQKLLGNDAKVERPNVERKRPPKKRSRPKGGRLGVTDAVRQVLRKDKLMSNAEITEAVKPLNPKAPANKTLSRAVSGAVYKMVKTGEVTSAGGKYKLAKGTG